MPAWLKWVGDLIAPLLNVLLGALRTRRLDEERDALARSDATSQAALETQEAINEAADARANLPPASSDPDSLAGELRSERSSAAGDREVARRRRPF